MHISVLSFSFGIGIVAIVFYYYSNEYNNNNNYNYNSFSTTTSSIDYSILLYNKTTTFLQSFLQLSTKSTTTNTTMSEETMNNKMKHVLINIAMEAEAKPFIEHLQLEIVPDFYPKHLPFIMYSGIYQDHTKVTVITNGKDSVYKTDSCNVGTIAAATITMITMQQFLTQSNDTTTTTTALPDIYINAGTAGGFQRNGASVGTIYIVNGFVFHDRRIPIPGYDIYGIGKSNVSINVNKLLDHFNSSSSSTANTTSNTDHVWKSGICTTGDSLDKTTECDRIMEEQNATIKDMEGAAIGWVMSMYPQIKFGSIKVITDIVDGPIATQDEFLQNLQTASQQLQYALPTVIDYIATTNLDEL